jgi:mannose-6-phosphate isomerase-like protein (cupin superfamily)
MTMTSPRTAALAARKQDDSEWLQITPGRRFRIRVASSQTMGAYSMIEIVADPYIGVPLHIHNSEEEHFIVLEGTLDIAIGDRRWDAPAGTSVTVRRGLPHAWCNPSIMPLRLLAIFSPGRIEALFRASAGVSNLEELSALAARYGTHLIGPSLQATARSICSPRRYTGL